MESEVEAYLRRKYERQVADIEIVEKEDLDLKNHLSGLRKKYLKVSFDTVQQLMEVKRDLSHIVERNQAKFDALEAYESILAGKRPVHMQMLTCGRNKSEIGELAMTSKNVTKMTQIFDHSDRFVFLPVPSYCIKV
ncbi:DNA polymerase epsilon catalytic subunit A-like isoform X2 [Raphanus sativus]|uniref:DNA polymerase epsilon catalytic subunit n=1 Tax=Raphanus sativus TaxID=3726 RepID=A0A9W3C998_RAPSA|nr:DNA polymerase epsilon catalytic subunit A-like isoform X2 [Raphanus sativus]XP_056855122.1 DNA polymerase epsilon catalytic subunit A-like isoform X2 [Raphanus sativus]